MGTQPFSMPSAPSYFLHGGAPVYFNHAINYGRNPSGWLPTYFILHDTDGLDSRQELFDSTRFVSVHYLIGVYPGYATPIVVKYLSEVSDYANGAGYGSLGGVSGNLNPLSIQFEIEYRSMSAATLSTYATVIASSLKFWSLKGADVRFLLHKDIDSRKRDPRYNFQSLMRDIYALYNVIP